MRNPQTAIETIVDGRFEAHQTPGNGKGKCQNRMDLSLLCWFREGLRTIKEVQKAMYIDGG